MHLLLLLIVVIVRPSLLSLPFSGGITITIMPFQKSTCITSTNTNTKQKTNVSHADASPARAVKCLSPVSDRDADNRSRLPATNGAVDNKE